MKKLENKISMVGILLFCTIIVGFLFVQTPLNLKFIPDGGGLPPPRPFVWKTKAPDQTCNSGQQISLTWTADSGYDDRWTKLERSPHGLNQWTEVGSTSWWFNRSPITYPVTVPTVGPGETKAYDYRVIFHDSSTYTGNHYDTAVVTVNNPEIDTDGDGLSDDYEAYLLTDPNNKYDPLGDHFEFQSSGSSPDGWYSDPNVNVYNSESENIENYDRGNVVKMASTGWGDPSSMYKYLNLDVSSLSLLSFTAAYDSEEYDIESFGEMTLFNDMGIDIFRIKMSHNQLKISEPSIFIHSIPVDMINNHMYLIEVLFQCTSTSVNVNVFVDTINCYFGSFPYDYSLNAGGLYFENIPKIDNTPCDFYVDNIYLGNIDHQETLSNIPFQYPIPQTWIYHPDITFDPSCNPDDWDIAAVYQVYEEVIDTVNYEIAVDLGMGIKFGTTYTIKELYESTIDSYYYIETNGEDVIFYIDVQGYVDKQAVYLPGESKSARTFITDFVYTDSSFACDTPLNYRDKFLEGQSMDIFLRSDLENVPRDVEQVYGKHIVDQKTGYIDHDSLTETVFENTLSLHEEYSFSIKVDFINMFLDVIFGDIPSPIAITPQFTSTTSYNLLLLHNIKINCEEGVQGNYDFSAYLPDDTNAWLDFQPFIVYGDISPINQIPLPTINSPADISVISGSSNNQISWTADSFESGLHNYEIYRNGVWQYSGQYDNNVQFTYTFTAPGDVNDYQYTCRVYNSQGYTDDTVIVTVTPISGPLPTINSPGDFFAMSGSSNNHISWVANSLESGSHTYNIYRDGSLQYSGIYENNIQFTYTFTAPSIPLGHFNDYQYTCRVYNSQGYTEDTVIVTVANI